MRKYVCVCGRSKIHVKMGKIRGQKRAEKESGIKGGKRLTINPAIDHRSSIGNLLHENPK